MSYSEFEQEVATLIVEFSGGSLSEAYRNIKDHHALVETSYYSEFSARHVAHILTNTEN